MTTPSRPSHYHPYWGKASPALPPTRPHSPGWHGLAYHCLDVAAVGYEYLARAPSFKALLRECLGELDDDGLLGWIAFWLALHDVGKFAEAFQGQKPELFAQLRQRPPKFAYGKRHDSLGWLYWQDVLLEQMLDQAWFGDDAEHLEDGLAWWMRAVTGHHGMPPEPNGGHWRQHFEPQDDKAAISEFVAELRQLLFTKALAKLAPQLDEERFTGYSRILSWWIAGLTVLADWLGSDTAYFPYCAEPMPLAEYWARARRQARQALAQSGVLPAARQTPLSFQELFPHIAQPSPLQTWAEQVPLADGPQIYLLEDVTGAGKTEAAVTLSHRLMAADLADGFFIALPTMATANAMYGRIRHVYQALFGDLAHLSLAHGQRKLVDYFAQSILRPGQREADPQQQDDSATARCSAWLADRNKSALLAPASVGTIDQALLAVLHSKHQSLRLLGLFRKVLVVDEVHACDSYMQAVLENLLEFHAQVGGSAILLSATLPTAMKQSLLAAFAKGRGSRCQTLSNNAYPLTTVWPGHSPTLPLEQEIQTRPDVRRTLETRYLSDEKHVIAELLAVLAQGGCACWMRNTVFDALDAYQKLAPHVAEDKLILFHARFCYGDRLETESQILKFFGPESTPEQRAGKLVIATQVAEQSLDADWDFVVSDLAPIDRLIQRAGRLRRHPRDSQGQRLTDPQARDQRGTACLWLFGPTWTENPAADWFKAPFPKAAGVYPHHGQLWRTAQLLQAGQLHMPDDARRLIEDVFSPSADFPESLQKIAAAVEGEHYGDRSLAQQHGVKLADGYVRGAYLDWWSEAASPSRLGEATTTVVLARWQDGQLRFWHDHDEHNPAQAWAYSSLRIARRLIAEPAPATDPAEKVEIERLAALLPGQGKWMVLLPLTEINDHWQGFALAAPKGKNEAERKCWRYSALFGLQELNQEKGAE